MIKLTGSPAPRIEMTCQGFPGVGTSSPLALRAMPVDLAAGSRWPVLGSGPTRTRGVGLALPGLAATCPRAGAVPGVTR